MESPALDVRGAGRAAARSLLPFHKRLRAATAPDHESVDAAYARFDLADARSYGDFLSAHARILPAAEQEIGAATLVPGWAGRAAALIADLAALDRSLPAPIPFALKGEAARWGALYVVEGSRLGGAMLAKRVGAGLPHAYLSARHGSGGWRALLAAIDAAAAGQGQEWSDAALAAAGATFAAYRQAAG